jgi:DNA polymerase III delta prime subunit
MPHVIISGMPGIGKTTSILCLARQLLGDAYKEAVLELNASDERGASYSLLQVSWREIPLIPVCEGRHRCGPQSNKGFCSEKSHIASGSTQDCDPG